MLRILLLLAIAGSLPHALAAQDFNDPYSTYGVGRIQDNEFAHRSGAKPLGLVHQENSSYSLQNPASYAFLEYTTFNMGLGGKLYEQQRQDSSYQDNRIGFGYLSLGFPIMKDIGWGASFGVTPFSHLGYRQARRDFDPEIEQDYQIRRTGDGGISKFYLGNGFQITPRLSLGFNVGYLFGELERSLIYDYQALRGRSSRSITSRQVGDFIFEGGVQYSRDLQEDLELLVGANARIPRNINYTINQTTLTYQSLNDPRLSFEDIENTILVDTTDQTADKTRSMKLPGSYQTTVALQKANDWQVGLGFSYEQWSTMEIGSIDQELGDRTEVSLSGELLPSRESLSTYIERMSFRFGIKYANSYLQPTGEQLNRYTLSFGTSFPVSQQQSTVNLGLVAGQLGKDEDQLYRERFLRFKVGLNLNERWFRSRKVR